ncbi:hypothetical protein OsJ_07645 [Oryza sativa Japonica Group]|uniref:TCP domain-containing protein n=1 Tax=Oryza sativa subsp. japonica TaxID=39947 RepID=B9F197_ORYSJ|nr:hypothetical protein OsJ_07645 [Oryza sativa Japonica Group]
MSSRDAAATFHVYQPVQIPTATVAPAAAVSAAPAEAVAQLVPAPSKKAAGAAGGKDRHSKSDGQTIEWLLRQGRARPSSPPRGTGTTPGRLRLLLRAVHLLLGTRKPFSGKRQRQESAAADAVSVAGAASAFWAALPAPGRPDAWGFSPLDAQPTYVPMAQAHHHHLNLLAALSGAARRAEEESR